ncbi:hypothetical protein BH11PSE2_BH11PSE2_09540 [soil metagenome]
MSTTFLIGAILGSGFLIAFGRAPAQRVLARVKANRDNTRR